MISLCISLIFFAPITIIKIKNILKLSDLSIHKLFVFLKKTVKESCSFEKYYFNDVFICKRYDGLLGTVNVLLEEFDKYLYEDKKTYDFQKNIKSYIMYRNLFFDYINLFGDKFTFIDKNYMLFGQKQLNNILFILLKHEKYSKELIEKIRETLIKIFKLDFNYINTLYNNVFTVLFPKN